MFSLCCLQIPKKVCFLYKFTSGQLVISLHLGKLLSTGQPGFGSLQPANPKGQVCEPPLAQLVQQAWMWSKVKNPGFCFQCFLLPWRVGRKTISKPCVLALQLVISMCSFELLQPAFLPGCLCGDEASQRGSVYPQPRCQGIKCLPLCPLLHLWIII